MGANDAAAVSLDQADHHLQNRIVAAGQQGADGGRHFHQDAQRRAHLAPFRAAAHTARHHDTANAIPVEQPIEGGEIADADDGVIIAFPTPVAFVLQRDDDGIFARRSRGFGDIGRQKTAAGNDRQPARSGVA